MALINYVQLNELYRELNELRATKTELLDALQRLMSNDCPLTGGPTYEELVEHWEYEDSQGRGEAQDQLFALRAVAKALGK